MRKRLHIRYFVLGMLFVFLIACKEVKTEAIQKEPAVQEVQFDQALATKLEKMTEVDQLYAGIPQGKHKGDWDTWKTLRDSVNRLHQKFLKEVIDTSGYPGFDRVGASGESDFWVMVQHSDFDPAWQEEVLALLKEQVKANNASLSQKQAHNDHFQYLQKLFPKHFWSGYGFWNIHNLYALQGLFAHKLMFDKLVA